MKRQWKTALGRPLAFMCNDDGWIGINYNEDLHLRGSGWNIFCLQSICRQRHLHVWRLLRVWWIVIWDFNGIPLDEHQIGIDPGASVGLWLHHHTELHPPETFSLLWLVSRSGWRHPHMQMRPLAAFPSTRPVSFIPGISSASLSYLLIILSIIQESWKESWKNPERLDRKDGRDLIWNENGIWLDAGNGWAGFIPLM